MLTGKVTYRMTYNINSYIRVRFGIYYFVRRVPADLQHYYRSDRVSMSLRTKSENAAKRTAQSICQRLDNYWHGLRLQKMEVPALHLVISTETDARDNSLNKQKQDTQTQDIAEPKDAKPQNDFVNEVASKPDTQNQQIAKSRDTFSKYSLGKMYENRVFEANTELV